MSIKAALLNVWIENKCRKRQDEREEREGGLFEGKRENDESSKVCCARVCVYI